MNILNFDIFPNLNPPKNLMEKSDEWHNRKSSIVGARQQAKADIEAAKNLMLTDAKAAMDLKRKAVEAELQSLADELKLATDKEAILQERGSWAREGLKAAEDAKAARADDVKKKLKKAGVSLSALSTALEGDEKHTKCEQRRRDFFKLIQPSSCQLSQSERQRVQALTAHLQSAIA